MISKRDIGLNIKSIRHKAGLRQEDLAKKIKTTKETISRIERAKSNYRVNWLFKIAEVLNCGVENFCASKETSNDGNFYDFIRFALDEYGKRKNKKGG